MVYIFFCLFKYYLNLDTFYTGTLDGKVLKIVNNEIIQEIKFTNNSNCGENFFLIN